MGREVKHVALDFDWPLHKVWKGFVNPYSLPECPHCRNGFSRTHEALAQHINALIWDRAGRDDPLYRRVTTFLTDRSPVLEVLGHDSIDAYHAIDKLAQLAGLPEGWDTCPHCDGEGLDLSNAELVAAHGAWQEYEPPAGEGWQLWETVTEGSPVSPVFATPEELASWLVANDTSITRDTNYEGWMRFLTGPGWAPSMVADATGIHSGVSEMGRE